MRYLAYGLLPVRDKAPKVAHQLLVGPLCQTIGLGMVPRGQAAGVVDQMAEGIPEPRSDWGTHAVNLVLQDEFSSSASRGMSRKGNKVNGLEKVVNIW